jgi:hypothetical protein
VYLRKSKIKIKIKMTDEDKIDAVENALDGVDIQEAVNRIKSTMTRGQGWADFSYPVPQWKLNLLYEDVKPFTKVQKRAIWFAFKKQMTIGGNQEGGDYADFEVREIAHVLEVKIKIIPAYVEELEGE